MTVAPVVSKLDLERVYSKNAGVPTMVALSSVTRLLSGAALALLLVVVSAAQAVGAWQDDIGYTQLLSELGSATPTGQGITASQVEAFSSGNYLPNTGLAEFAGKSFTTMSGTSGISGHATTVGQYLYGSSTGIATDISTIDNWSADDWLYSGALRVGSISAPLIETRDVQNHSWVSTTTNEAAIVDASRRFDYAIQRDNFVAVVGLNNGSSTDIPGLLAHSYNSISVGLTNGNHSRGFTTFDGVGRSKPEIVAPASYTSYATPIVGSAAALLLETAQNTSALANAQNSEAVKALLLAGATKSEFSDWDRTNSRPLDEVYGAGELNVYRSYQALAAGEQEAGILSTVDLTGWDFDATGGGDSLYFFDVTEGFSLDEFSVALTWNRVVTDGAGAGWGNPTSTLANLDLELWSADGFTLDTQLDFSNSTVDNVEHIYRQNMEAGRYALRLTSDTAGTDYAMAWYSEAVSVPEPATWLMLVVGGICLGGFWYRRSRR